MSSGPQPDDELVVERDEGLAILRLNRPTRLNAFSPAMLRRFAAEVPRLAVDPGVRTILITGAGRAHHDPSHRLRAADFEGGKPANTKDGFSSEVTPLAINAVMTALAPGMGITPRPASRTARTMRAPGSLTAGAPASETSATRSPA